VITHFEQGTPLEAAAIDIMEVINPFFWKFYQNLFLNLGSFR